MNTEEPIAETRRPHPHRKLATNTANVGKRSSARQIPGKIRTSARNPMETVLLFRTGNKRHQSIQQTPDRDHEKVPAVLRQPGPAIKNLFMKNLSVFTSCKKGARKNKIRPAPQRAR